MTNQNMRVESIAKILTNKGDGNVLNLTLSEHLKYPREIVSARDIGDVNSGICFCGYQESPEYVSHMSANHGFRIG